MHAAVHVVAVQRIEANAAARRRQRADLPHQAVHCALQSTYHADTKSHDRTEVCGQHSVLHSMRVLTA